jgi:hypothetical protein
MSEGHGQGGRAPYNCLSTPACRSAVGTLIAGSCLRHDGTTFKTGWRIRLQVRELIVEITTSAAHRLRMAKQRGMCGWWSVGKRNLRCCFPEVAVVAVGMKFKIKPAEDIIDIIGDKVTVGTATNQ